MFNVSFIMSIEALDGLSIPLTVTVRWMIYECSCDRQRDAYVYLLLFQDINSSRLLLRTKGRIFSRYHFCFS